MQGGAEGSITGSHGCTVPHAAVDDGKHKNLELNCYLKLCLTGAGSHLCIVAL